MEIKRHGNLFKDIVSLDNLYLAYKLAKRGKGSQSEVIRFELDIDGNLKRLREQLVNKTFTTGKYREKVIHEPKKRTIYILPFYPDRIVHHAIMNVIEPIWERLFIKDSYACLKGKGLHAGSRRTAEFVRRNKYCLKCDVSKFYPNINHAVAMKIIGRKIKDKDVLALWSNLVNSMPGDTNIPIGNYTSQWLGNLYLNELDTFVKTKMRHKDYIRYCDDFILFSNSKQDLQEKRAKIIAFMQDALKLPLSICELFPTSRGVDFLGYRHYPAGYLLLRKSTTKRVRKRLKAIPYKLKHGMLTPMQAKGIIESTKGWIGHANTHNLKLKLELEELEKLVREAA